MERYWKLSLNIILSIGIGGTHATAFSSPPTVTLGQQPLTAQQIKERTEYLKEVCAPNQNSEECKNATVQIVGNTSHNTCSAATEDLKKELRSKQDAASTACRQSGTLGATGGEDGASDASGGSMGECHSRIKRCDDLRKEMNAVIVDKRDEKEDTRAMIQTAMRQMNAMGLAASDLTLPATDSPLSEEEQIYFQECPRMSLKAYNERKDKLEKRIEELEKKKVDDAQKIQDLAKKSIEEEKKFSQDRAKTEADQRKDAEAHAKSVRQIQEDASKAKAEAQKAQVETHSQMMDRESKLVSLENRRKASLRKLQNQSIYENICMGSWNEKLAKTPAGGRALQGGAAAALRTRSLKADLLAQCVSEQWHKEKADYDQVKSEILALRTERQYLSQQKASLTQQSNAIDSAQASQMQAAQKSQADAATSAQQLQMQLVQNRSMELNRVNQELNDRRRQEQKTESDIKKAKQDLVKLGAEPTGESTLADASSAISSIETAIASLSSAADNETPSCKQQVDGLVTKARQEINSATASAARASGDAPRRPGAAPGARSASGTGNVRR